MPFSLSPTRPTVRPLARLAEALRNHASARNTKERVTLTADDGPIVDQLRALLSERANAKRFINHLEKTDDGDRFVSRKEFRRAVWVLGYIAPGDDLNLLFDELDSQGRGEIHITALKTHLQRMQKGEPAALTGRGAEKLAAKAARKHSLGGSPAKVLPFNPSAGSIVLPSLATLSPAMARAGKAMLSPSKAARALSPAFTRATALALSSVSPAMTRAAADAARSLESPLTLRAGKLAAAKRNDARLAEWEKLMVAAPPKRMDPPAFDSRVERWSTRALRELQQADPCM